MDCTIQFTNHAIDRFHRRFPDYDFINTFNRSVEISRNKCRKLVNGAINCTKTLYDAESGAIFIIDRDSNLKLVCMTVVRAR